MAIQHQEPTDKLEVNGLGGNDAFSAAALAAGAIALALDGGAGDDSLAGGRGVETLLGGDGNDSIDGNGGNDMALLGAGNDTFVWDPGDGSDTVEGQAGSDTMLFNGADAAERIDAVRERRAAALLPRRGEHHDGHERRRAVDFRALGGADMVTVNDLTGTDVSTSRSTSPAHLGGATGDGQPDR